ncbi:hypothetical protein JCM10212_002976 [Sporobolomyces blumeae]
MAESAPIPGLSSETGGVPSITKFVEVKSVNPVVERSVAQFVKTPGGRDALLKSIQYTLRLLIWSRQRKGHPRTPVLARLFAIVATLSALRRLVALSTLVLSLRDLPRRINPFHTLANDGRLPGRKDSTTRDRAIETLSTVARSGFDLVAVVSDNVFLFSKLGLIWISPERTQLADKVSDFASLGSALVGLADATRARAKVWSEGRQRRLKATKLERELEELEFWEGPARAGRGGATTGQDRGERGKVVNAEEQAHRVDEERKLRERIRFERTRLRRLRDEADKLRWTRLRLIAEAVFYLYDAFELQLVDEATKSLSGATATLIEAKQAWSDYLKA